MGNAPAVVSRVVNAVRSGLLWQALAPHMSSDPS